MHDPEQEHREGEPDARPKDSGAAGGEAVRDLPLPGDSPPPFSAWSDARTVPDWVQELQERTGPARIGAYLLGPLLGEGGMGVVHLAWDVVLGRRVALKLVRGESPDLVRRMIQEARLQARVEHPAVCRIYQIGEELERPYIAMQFIQGANLGEWAPHLGLESKLRLVIQVADAVHAAHRMGLIHRDLKPSNILVEQDEAGLLRPYVLDFGLARDTGGLDITQHGIAVGSPSYMAPEQAVGARVDERTDVYGLGATLYEMLSGRPPFRGGSAVDTLRMVMESEAPMLRALDPDIPADLESVVHKCLDKDHTRRYGSARELRDDLQRCLDGEPVEARRQNRLRRAWRRLKRNQTLSLVVAAASTIVLAAAGLATWTWREAREQAFWAQRFGQQVREMDATLRNAHLFPLHDLRPERTDVQLKLDRIQEQMKQLGKASQGPGWAALGQGYLMLDRPSEARRALQAAWDSGYRTADAAAALVEALSDLHRRETESAFMLPRESLRLAVLAEIQRAYEAPLSACLEQVRAGGGITPLQASAVARIEHRPADAMRLAREAYDRQRWNYEARMEEIEALFQAVREAAGREEERLAGARLEEAERQLVWLKEAARSDPRVHLQDAQARLLRVRLGVAGRPLEQCLQEGLSALDRALRADPASGEPHLARAALFRWIAAGQPVSAAQRGYWLDRAIEAAGKATSDLRTRARAEACRGSLVLEKAQRVAALGGDPSTVVVEGCELWKRSLAEEGNEPFRQLQRALEVAQAQILLADHALRRGKDPVPALEAALLPLEDLLATEPGSVEALLEAARVERRLGEALARKGGNPEPWYTQARDRLDHQLQAQPDNASAWNALGAVARSQAEDARRRGRDPSAFLDSAATAFGNARKHRPRAATYSLNQQEVRILQAELALRTGQDPSARIQEAREALAAVGDPEGALDLAAEAALGASRIHRVIAEAQLLSGRNADGELRSAETWAKEAVRLDSGSARAWRELGRILALAAQAGPFRAEVLAEARRAFTRVLRFDPSDREAILPLGRLDLLEAAFQLLAGRNPSAALAAAEGWVTAVQKIDPHDPEARLLRAEIALARVRGSARGSEARLQQARRAVAEANGALAINPRQTDALRILARAESLLGSPSAKPVLVRERKVDRALEILLEPNG